MDVKQLAIGLRGMLILSLLMAGCSAGNSDPNAASQDDTRQSQAFKSLIAPTDEQVQSFAESFVQAIATGDVQTADSLIDYDFILARATELADVEKEFQEGFMRGFNDNLGQRGLGRQMVANTQPDGSFRLLKTHTVDGQKRAMFRVVMTDGSLNYLDMILAIRPGPLVKAVDIYVVAAGEQMSQTIRRIYLMSAAQINPSLLQRLSGRDGDFVKNMERIAEMTQQFQAGNGGAALSAYRQLPQSMRDEKSMMLIATQAASLVSDNEYLSMLEEFRRVHANDACSDIISIDYYFMRKEFDQALECINRLDTAIGGDPYLNIHRAQLMVERGELDEARKLCESSIETAPDEEDLYWVVVTITLRQKKFADTVTWLNRLQSEFELELSDLQSVPEYSEFVESPEYSAWMAERNRPADQ